MAHTRQQRTDVARGESHRQTALGGSLHVREYASLSVPRVTQADRRNSLAVVLLGLTLGMLYFVAIDLRDPAFSLGQQQHVISGEAGSPYRYRVLVPWLLELGTRAFAFTGPPDVAFRWASAAYACLGFVCQLFLLYVLVRQWFSPLQSLVGVAFTSGATLVTFGYFNYQPWSILEVAFFSLGFLLASRGHWALFGIVVVFASLNRETAVFLPLALLLASLDRPLPMSVSALRTAAHRHETRLAFAYVVLSTAIFAGLRLVRGPAPPVDQLGDVIVRNLERNNLIAAGMILLVFLGFGWLFAAWGVARAPSFVRRVARVVPWYLAAFAIWGWWREARILTSLYPVLIPLVLAYCYTPSPLPRGEADAQNDGVSGSGARGDEAEARQHGVDLSLCRVQVVLASNKVVRRAD